MESRVVSVEAVVEAEPPKRSQTSMLKVLSARWCAWQGPRWCNRCQRTKARWLFAVHRQQATAVAGPRGQLIGRNYGGQQDPTGVRAQRADDWPESDPDSTKVRGDGAT